MYRLSEPLRRSTVMALHIVFIEKTFRLLGTSQQPESFKQNYTLNRRVRDLGYLKGPILP